MFKLTSGLAAAAATAILLAPTAASAATISNDAPVTAEPSATATTPATADDDPLTTQDIADGTWVSYADAPAAYSADIAAASNAPLSSEDASTLSALDSTDAATSDDVTETVAPDSVPPEPSGGCPSGSTYNGANQKWSCLEIQKDNGGSGHAVWIRIGNKGGFGYLHAFTDHNLDLDPILVTVANNSHGLKQKNGRYLYGEVFVAKSKAKQFVEVYEQRTKGVGSPDSHEMGVVTAFCRNASYAEENQCPEWVNETL